jgi:hypothetical protein
MLTVCMSTCMSVSLYVMKLKAKHAAIAARLKKPFVFDDKTFIVQYELNFQVIPSVWWNEAPCHLLNFFKNKHLKISIICLPGCLSLCM